MSSAALSGDKCGLRDLFSTTVEMTETKTKRGILLLEKRDRLQELVFDQTFNSQRAVKPGNPSRIKLPS